MEKLKCSSCGGELQVEENKEYAKCNYCGARYKLNEDLNVNFKIDDNLKEILNNGLENAHKSLKLMVIPALIFFCFIIITFAVSSIRARENRKNALERQKEIQEQAKQQQEKIMEEAKQQQEKAEEENKKLEEEMDKNQFNFDFERENGTKNAFFLKSTFDKIVRSNKINDRKISLVFNGTETTEESEIINIKQSLDGDYEVSINYDNDGYVNKIVVEKIN